MSGESKGRTIVSVVIPIRNEEKYIRECIESILMQDYPKENMEIIFVDGNSEDNTVEIINEYIDKHGDLIKVFNNPNKTVPYAMNIGIKESKGIYIVRLDAHSEYNVDYISKCVYYLENTDADNVGGPMIAKGNSEKQKVVSASYYSKFALGGGKFHDENYEGYSDTVYLGAYKKDKLIEIGLYDEKFTRNQDDELNYRLIKNNGKIFITPKIKSIYYPRESLKKLFSQYYQYGWWKVEVIRKHGKPARISHLIPSTFVLFLIAGSILSVFSNFVSKTFSLILLAYLILNFISSFSNKHIKGFKNKLLLIWVNFILHISYGIGFIFGVFKIKKI